MPFPGKTKGLHCLTKQVVLLRVGIDSGCGGIPTDWLVHAGTCRLISPSHRGRSSRPTVCRLHALFTAGRFGSVAVESAMMPGVHKIFSPKISRNGVRANPGAKRGEGVGGWAKIQRKPLKPSLTNQNSRPSDWPRASTTLRNSPRSSTVRCVEHARRPRLTVTYGLQGANFAI